MIFILGAAGKEVGETTRIVGKARQRRGVDVGMPNKSTVSRHAHLQTRLHVAKNLKIMRNRLPAARATRTDTE